MTSNSDSSISNKDQKHIESEVSSKPNSNFPNGCQTTASIEPPENHKEEEEEEEAEETESTSSSSSLDLIVKTPPPFSGAIEVPENDEGFKTPTDQMIPVITECPPAPKKQKKQEEPRKRKASPASRRSLRIDCSEDDLGREIKRAKRPRSGKTE